MTNSEGREVFTFGFAFQQMEAPMVRMNRTSSIEREPLTLSFDQIQSARDLAIYVLNTKTVEEATKIFTEGLKPVVSAACGMGSYTRMDMDSGEELQLVKDVAAEATAFRDIVSAPF